MPKAYVVGATMGWIMAVVLKNQNKNSHALKYAAHFYSHTFTSNNSSANKCGISGTKIATVFLFIFVLFACVCVCVNGYYGHSPKHTPEMDLVALAEWACVWVSV